MSIYDYPTFDFSNATFTHSKTPANPDRLVVDKVVPITDERMRVASWRDCADANGRLPGEERVWRTRTGNKIHRGYNHSFCGVRANIEYLVNLPEDARNLAASGTLCEKCFGAHPDIIVNRLALEAERRQENRPVHRALCVTLAAARRRAQADARGESAVGADEPNRTAWRIFKAISDAIAAYWQANGATREEQEKAAMKATRQQEERLEGMEVKEVTCPVMKQSRDLEITGPGGTMRQVVGLTWAEAEHLHKLLGAALEAHRGPQGPQGPNGGGEAQRDADRVRNATEQGKALLSLQARGGDASAVQALADLMNDGHPLILGEVDGWSRGVRCNQPYRMLLTRSEHRGSPGAPLVRVEQWIQREGVEAGWYPTGGSWYLDTLLDGDLGRNRLSLDFGAAWEVRGNLAGLLGLAKQICDTAGVKINWLHYHKQNI